MYTAVFPRPQIFAQSHILAWQVFHIIFVCQDLAESEAHKQMQTITLFIVNKAKLEN